MRWGGMWGRSGSWPGLHIFSLSAPHVWRFSTKLFSIYVWNILLVHQIYITKQHGNGAARRDGFPTRVDRNWFGAARHLPINNGISYYMVHVMDNRTLNNMMMETKQPCTSMKETRRRISFRLSRKMWKINVISLKKLQFSSSGFRSARETSDII